MARTGRPRGFDEDEVVDAARDLFWDRGYAATSVQDLTERLGIGRESLYGAFGAKHALYLRALTRYRDERQSDLERDLGEGPVLPALRAALGSPSGIVAARLAADAPQRGCMMGNAVAELAPVDGQAKRIAHEAWDRFVTTVAAALARGQAEGEVARTAPPRTQAVLLLALAQGLTLVDRALDDADALAGVLDAALEGLAAR